MTRIIRLLVQAGALVLVLLALPAPAADSLAWNAKQDRVAADITDWDMTRLLKKIAGVSGWHVMMEAGAYDKISVRFKDLPTDDALRHLLNDISYVKFETNGLSQLIVYRTKASAATVAIEAAKAEAKKDYRIPNELIVRLKRNSNETIEDIAKALGATILERDDRLKIYRLKFQDEAAAVAAATQLTSDPSVAFVDNNYTVDPPTPFQVTPTPTTAFGPAGPTSLLNPKPRVNGPTIGLIDTAVQMQDQFKGYVVTPMSVVGQPDVSGTDLTHGTSMFETLMQGMADYPSKILPVDVYPSGESTTTYDVAEGIIAAINAGANPINLSLGGTGDSSLLRSIIQEGNQKGILFVAASGNDSGTGNTYPAAYPGVLAITASAPNGQLATYANDGPFVQGMAPGTSVVYLNGQAWQVEGTSTATAFATSGIAQIVNQQHIPLDQAVTEFIHNHPPPKP